MRKITAIICLIFFLSGCSQNVSTELSDRLIIEAIGIDRQDKQYKISVLALNTLQTGSANSTETPDGIAKVFTATGNSIADALAQIDIISTQIPLYSQASVLIIGRDFAKNEPLNDLNFFIREYTTRDSILLAVADSTADEIISADLGKNMLTSKAIKNLLMSGKRNALTIAVPLYKFIGNLLNKNDAAYLPILKVENNEQNKDEISSVGIALFRQNSLSSTIDQNMLQGFLWSKGMIENALVEIEYKNNNVSLAVKNAKTIINANKKSPYSCCIEISFSCDILANNSNIQKFTEEDIRQITLLAERKVKEETENFVSFSLHENSCDCLEICNLLCRNDPDLTNLSSDKLLEIAKNTQITVTTKAKIIRTGRLVIEH